MPSYNGNIAALNSTPPVPDREQNSFDSEDGMVENENPTSLDQQSFQQTKVKSKASVLSSSKRNAYKWCGAASDIIIAGCVRCQPVVVLILVAFLATLALSVHRTDSELLFLPQFTGITLIFFAMQKLFDVQWFKDGFAQFDLVTMRWPKYGYWYPVMELGLGLGLITGYFTAALSFLTVIMMSVTATGIGLALLNNKDFHPVRSSDTLLQLPLSSISLIETVGISILAIAMFARSV